MASQLNCGGWAFYDKHDHGPYLPKAKPQRRQLLKHIKDNKIKGVVFLSGDYHSSFVGYVNGKNDSYPIIEVCSSPNGSPVDTSIASYISDNPDQTQFAYLSPHKNYINLKTDVDNNRINITVVNKNSSQDNIVIDIGKYTALQSGDVSQLPISVNGVDVM